MKKPLISIFCIIIICISSISAQSPQDKVLQSINQNVLQAQLGFLASDWMEGRMAGEKGESISADYIASMLQLYGVKPWGDMIRSFNTIKNISEERSYFQKITLLKTVLGDQQELKVKSTDGPVMKTVNFTYNVDFNLRPATESFEVEAPVVFAGYGFKNDKLKFNDYNKLDLKGKFILKISGVPVFAAEKLSAEEVYSSRREFEKYALEQGAAGIIEFNPDIILANPGKNNLNMSPSENTPRPAAYNASYSIPERNTPVNLLRISISAKVAEEMLRGTGNSVEDYIKKAGSNQTYTFSSVNAKSVYIKSTVKSSTVEVKNIIGRIEGNNPDEVIVIGAHYDHVGMNAGYIWNGADDNGSGTVGVLTIAKALMETGQKPGKTIIIALWTAEEEGLLGSKYFVKNPGFPVKNIKLNVNFDMISRYITDDQPKKVVMTYTSTNKNFRDITVSNLKKYGIDLDIDYQPSADPPGGTDHRSFVEAGISVMRFKPGHRVEYHTPYDEISTIDWDIMEKITRISYANIWELANSEW
jgi:hypothetical protein